MRLRGFPKKLNEFIIQSEPLGRDPCIKIVSTYLAAITYSLRKFFAGLVNAALAE